MLQTQSAFAMRQLMITHEKPTSVFACFLLLLIFDACTNSDTSTTTNNVTDTVAIAAGKQLFNQHCSSCHNFSQNAIGPNLSGVTMSEPSAWLHQFIKNPKAVIDAGDARAQALLKQYKVVMPSFASFNDQQFQNLIAFLATHQEKPNPIKAKPGYLTNPIPDTIASSGLQVAMQLVTQLPRSGNERPYTRIAKLDYIPGDTTLFVADQRGLMYRLSGDTPQLFLDITQWKPSFINQPGLATGFGSFAFHPQFLKNGIFYTSHTEPAHKEVADFALPDPVKSTLQWVVTEWKLSDPKQPKFSGTSRELLRIDMVAGIHGMQELTFNPYAKRGSEDYGLLYIGVGDGGSVENGARFVTHHTNRAWGSILRIDPLGHNSRNGHYGIPTSNPFYHNEDTTTVREIFAYGFRNPNRITWTRSGQLLATNIGQAHIESVNAVTRGADFGWPLREGSFALDTTGEINFVYPLSRSDSLQSIALPALQYDHDEGKAISGGFEYFGNEIPQLKGKYVFGDVPSGRLFYTDVTRLKPGGRATVLEWTAAIGGQKIDFHKLCGSDRVDLHFGRDAHGEIYLLTKADGKIYKLVSASQPFKP